MRDGGRPRGGLRARDDEVHRVVAAVLRGTSVELVGPRGSGRSALAAEAARTLEGLGRTVLRVRGDADLPDTEALRLSLPSRVLAGLDGATAPLARLHRVLADLLTDDTAVVVVDDADLLDATSRAVLGTLHATLGVAVLGTTCPERSPRRSGGWLADRCRPLARVPVGPLPVEDLHGVLADRLDAELSPAVTARIHAEAGGLPGTCVAVLEEAVARGGLLQADGLWVDAEPRGPTDGTAFEVYLADLPLGARDAVEVLAHAGPVAVGVAERLLPDGTLGDLETRGLVRTARGTGVDLVRVHPPGLADHVEATSPASRRARLAALVGPTGDVPGPADLVARTLARRHQDDLRAAARRWDAERTVPHAAQVLRLALSGPAESRLVTAVLDGTDLTDGTGGFDAVAVASYAARWALSRGEPADEVLASLERALPPGAPHHGALASLALLLRCELDRVDPGAGVVLRARIRGDDDDSRAARVALAGWCLLRGRHADALAALDDDRGRWPEPLRGSADLIHGLALFGSGDFGGGLVHARLLLDRAAAEHDGAAYAAGSVVAAVCLGARLDLDAVRGQLFDLLASGASSLALLLPVDRAARVLLASVALGTDQPAVSRGLVALAQRTPGGGALPFADDAWALALRHYAAGALDPAARVLDAAVVAHRERGHVFAAEITEMHRLVLRYDPVRAAAFAPTAERMGGPVFRAYLSAKQAIHDEDPRQLMSAADRLRRLAAVRGAARFYADAAGLFHLGGRPREAELARSAAQALGCGDPVGAPGPPLSAREVEVVELVARGLSNTAIAERLFLSRRTVESHLRNIKRKTGAVDRAAIESLAPR